VPRAGSSTGFIACADRAGMAAAEADQAELEAAFKIEIRSFEEGTPCFENEDIRFRGA
jgi:hypothetical protein